MDEDRLATLFNRIVDVLNEENLSPEEVLVVLDVLREITVKVLLQKIRGKAE